VIAAIVEEVEAAAAAVVGAGPRGVVPVAAAAAAAAVAQEGGILDPVAVAQGGTPDLEVAVATAEAGAAPPLQEEIKRTDIKALLPMRGRDHAVTHRKESQHLFASFLYMVYV